MTEKTLAATHLQALAAICGNQYILTDTAAMQHYGRDWTRVFTPAPGAIVRPADTEQVQAVVRYANQQQLAVVPSGGRTGLSGGAVAMLGEIVLCLERLNSLGELNPVTQTVPCGAGLITQQLQQFAAANGLFYPVEFAASGSSQLGGNIATNAGGINVMRYGMTRDWVRGLTVVTGTGDIITLNNGLLKNNAGYDLRQLLIGSEGTLGIITAAEMQLTRPPPALSVMVFGVPELAAVMNVLQLARQRLQITAYEFFSHNALSHVISHSNLQTPFATAAPFYALLEFEAADENALAVFEQGLASGAILDGVISQSETQAKNLWSLRENITEAIAHYKPYKNDLSVTVDKVPAFLEAVEQAVNSHYPGVETVWFGHIGDGNLHLNILKPEALTAEEFQAQCHPASQAIFAEVQRFGGSISAEHGVGLLKKPYLEFSRSSAEIDLMRAVKRKFDPNGVLNPGKVFD